MEEKLRFYKEENSCIKCYLCPHSCFLSEVKYGVCKIRIVKNNIPIVQTMDIYTTNSHVKGDKCPNCKEYINIVF